MRDGSLMRAPWKIAQFALGFILGMILFVGISGLAAYLFLSKLAKTPPKPVFADAVPPTEVEELEIQEATVETETVVSTPPEPEPEIEVYQARVTWSEGLTVRAEPDVNSERLGGVAYNQQLIVFADIQSEGWQKIKVPDTNLEGWVKAGNLEKID